MDTKILNKKRYEYIDVLKFVGIFAIYIGHFGESAGHTYDFVFQYHVPLFFFVSGCMVNIEKKRSFFTFLIHKIKTILIPCVFFALITEVIDIINSNQGLSQIWIDIKGILCGCIRNHFGGGLWFLTCLFVMSIAFYFIKKVRNRMLMLASCLFILALTRGALGFPIYQGPSWYWNIDSVMIYIIYYCIGFVAFPFMNQFLCSENKKSKYVLRVSGILTAAYTAFMFFGKNLLVIGIPTFLQNRWIDMLLSLVTVCILIWFNVLCAYCLRHCTLFQNIGQITLYLCGTEYCIKTFVSLILSTIGLQLSFPTPLATYLYTFFLLVISYKFFVPIVKIMLEYITSIKIFEE